MIKRPTLTFALLVVLLLALVAWRGRGPANWQSGFSQDGPSAPAPDVPPCVMDWSLPVNDENFALLLACYQQLYPLGTAVYVPPFCPPSADSPWVPMFLDNAACRLTLFGLPSMTPWTMTPSPSPTPAPPSATPSMPPPYP